jgi:hypothetical protein
MPRSSKSKSSDKKDVRKKILTPPAGVADSVDRITGEDRRWFEDHPNATSRTRPAAPGEFWPVFDSASVLHVIVTQVRPGFRLRSPVVRLNLPESDRVQ